MQPEEDASTEDNDTTTVHLRMSITADDDGMGNGTNDSRRDHSSGNEGDGVGTKQPAAKGYTPTTMP